jgi:hypothetical protein
MTWNYRVVRCEDGLRVFDVYYNEAGAAIGSGAAPAHVYGETIEDLKDQFALMLEALEQPILEEDEIGTHGRSNAK